MIKKEKIIQILQTCFDPEIPIDLWNLGLIYNIKINNKNISITMTLTTPGCTMAEHIAQDIKDKINALEEVENVDVEITFDPIWEPSMMTDKGKEILGFKTKESTDNNWE
ncbi:MAG: FeS assembly SUF system protein [Candidatus Marinimicrobia bacterium]|nr:FeS assembly SUF system protein [Candidatus Neomarinimicrobiota bacterium]|tara:strand:+ start:2019 stop:2348 length:330 start_codon:yes stop_codon:yes gene_type:complete